MNAMLRFEPLEAQLFAWFATMLIQVTLITACVLMLARLAKRNATLRHALLACGLLLVLISPISSGALQCIGFGVYTISSGASAEQQSVSTLSPGLMTDYTIAPATRIESKLQEFNDSPTEYEPDKSQSLAFENFLIEDRQDKVPVTLAEHQPQHASGKTLVVHTQSKLTGHLLRLLPWCVLWVWFLGIMCHSVRWIANWLSVKRILSQCCSLPESLESLFVSACNSLQIDCHRVRIRTSAMTHAPFVTGIFRPVIVVSTDLTEKLSSQPLSEILVHELAHVIRRDPLFLLMQQFARTLLWPHPLVLRLCCELTRASEEACDSYVLQWTAPTAYSRTLLQVAELGLYGKNASVAMSVIGSGSALSERVAALLDPHRNHATRLSRVTKIAVATFLSLLSIILLATVRFTSPISLAQSPVVQQKQSDGENSSEFLRGSGESLEFRLRGRLHGGAGALPQNARVEVHVEGQPAYAAHITGDRYEVWLPAQAILEHGLRVTGMCDDERRAAAALTCSGLHHAMMHGVDLVYEQPARNMTFHVTHQRQSVADARLQVITMGPKSSAHPVMITDPRGNATVPLLVNESVWLVTAWSDRGLLGGFQFDRSPDRDANNDSQTIEMVECQQKTIQVVDTNGLPVEGVRLRMQVAAGPDFNSIGTPEGYEVTSDRNGQALFDWFPKLPDVHCFDVELLDKGWVFQSQKLTSEALRVTVNRPHKRVRLEGIVSSGGSSIAGLVVQASSFQSEEGNHRNDLLTAVVDGKGKFAFEVLPGSTYCVTAFDDRLFCDPIVTVPPENDTDQRESLTLPVFEGYPVTIALTSGEKRKPIPRQQVLLIHDFAYTFQEGGRSRTGNSGPQTRVTTDEHGIAHAFARAAKLRVLAHTGTWQAESQIEVKADRENRIELHRERDEAVAASGRVILGTPGEIDYSRVKLFFESLDDQSKDRLSPVVDASGRVQFETNASAMGCFAFSHDGLLSGSTIIRDFTQPFSITLHPSVFLEGQVLNSHDHPIADRAMIAIPCINLRSPRRDSGYFSMEHIRASPIRASTDANGKYRIGPLPRLTEIMLYCEAKGPSSDEADFLDTCYFEVDDTRPPMTHRIGPALALSTTHSPEQRLTNMLRDARIGGYHAMVIVSDHSDQRCADFVQQQLLNYDANKNVAAYMQLRLDCGEQADPRSLALVQQRWLLPPVGNILLVSMDGQGRELGRMILNASAIKAREQTAVFVETHLPPVADAQAKWNAAFALAQQTNRRVWLRFGGRYCGPCHLLNRWIDDHLDLLDKEFVMLKIDNGLDKGAEKMFKEVTDNQMVGIPFFVFYHADGTRLIDSIGPVGNIGFFSSVEGQRHFRKMLNQARIHLTEEEIETLCR